MRALRSTDCAWIWSTARTAVQVVLELKPVWHGGLTCLVMWSMNSIEQHVDRQSCGVQFCEQ
jgi:hypothetical protein